VKISSKFVHIFVHYVHTRADEFETTGRKLVAFYLFTRGFVWLAVIKLSTWFQTSRINTKRDTMVQNSSCLSLTLKFLRFRLARIQEKKKPDVLEHSCSVGIPVWTNEGEQLM
jgi:hypothetical protein